jgi:conjugal transfer pilus assembly protein TraE
MTGEKASDEQKSYIIEYRFESGKFILRRLYEKQTGEHKGA